MTSYPLSFLHGFRLACLEEQLHVNTVAVYTPSRGQTGFDFKEQRPTNLYSGSKTITALAVGMAIDEGRLTLDTKLIDIFPDKKPIAADMLDQVTIRHMLKMSAGKHTRMFKTTDLNTDIDYLDLYFSERLDAKPGTSFYYNNITTYMLSRVVENVSGMRLDRYLRPRLFAPLGIERAVWHTCPHKHTLGYSDLHITSNDYAKIGKLLLERGRHGDQVLVDAAFIDAMHTDTIETGFWDQAELEEGYGYQCWLGSRQSSFRADGLYGQFSIVSPSQEAVVTVTSHNVSNPYAIVGAINREIFDLIDQLEE